MTGVRKWVPVSRNVLLACGVTALLVAARSPAAAISVRTDKPAYALGEPIVAHFQDLPGNLGDWIEFDWAGSPFVNTGQVTVSQSLAWTYTNGLKTGQVTWRSGPGKPGRYMVRLGLDWGGSAPTSGTFVAGYTFTVVPGNFAGWWQIKPSTAGVPTGTGYFWVAMRQTGSAVQGYAYDSSSGKLSYTFSAVANASGGLTTTGMWEAATGNPASLQFADAALSPDRSHFVWKWRGTPYEWTGEYYDRVNE